MKKKIGELESEIERIRISNEAQRNSDGNAADSIRKHQGSPRFHLEKNQQHYFKQRDDAAACLIPVEEYDDLKKRLDALENENKVIQTQNKESDKAIQDLERTVSDYRLKVSRLFNENTEFRRELDQNSQIKQILTERKAEIEKKAKQCSEKLRFYDIKVLFHFFPQF